MFERVRNAPSPLPHVSPTHFSALTVDGISLDTAIDHYLDWVEGRERAPSRRRKQGVPQPLPREGLVADGGGAVYGDNGAEVVSRRREDEFALRFVHRDDAHLDVYWYSVVRLSKVAPEGAATCAVRVEHATGRALPPFMRLPPIAGAPAVLARLLELPNAAPRQRDLATRPVTHVRAEDVEGFVKYILVDERRTLPLLLVSRSKETGKRLVDAKQLARLLHAQVIVYTIDSDATWAFAHELSSRGFSKEMGTCFDGATRLYHPGLSREQNPREHNLWLPERLEEFRGNATGRLAGEVAERVTWRALPRRFFSVLEDIDRTRARERAQKAIHATVVDLPDLSEKVISLERRIEELREQLVVSQDENCVWEAEATRYEKVLAESHQLLEMAEEERDEVVATSSSLRARITALEARGDGLSERQRDALRGLTYRKVSSLTEALILLEALYGDRVAILSSAWSSAKDSERFKDVEKAWGLLLVLVTRYWADVPNGGDSAGKKHFTNTTFASRESGTVESRRVARELRTFRYKGRELVMWKHLRVGKKECVEKTWRCHFEFDDETKKVVIGHCGKHLDFK